MTFDPILKLPLWASVPSSVNVMFPFISRACSSYSILCLLLVYIKDSEERSDKTHFISL